MTVIVNYGVGNLKSIQNMLAYIDVKAVISSDLSVIDSAERIILPGVGAFDAAITNIEKLNLRELLVKKAVKDKVPFMGICLGMQMLTAGSTEGAQAGLGIIEGTARRFEFKSDRNDLKIPHMGWNTINVNRDSRLFYDLPKESRFYFVHSYHVECDNSSDILSTTEHGYEFISAIEKDNIFGLQFHPEKSHKFGMKVLANFAELT